MASGFQNVDLTAQKSMIQRCPDLLSITVINTTTNENLGRKRFMPSDSLGRESGQEHGDWDPGPETEAEARKDC